MHIEYGGPAPAPQDGQAHSGDVSTDTVSTAVDHDHSGRPIKLYEGWTWAMFSFLEDHGQIRGAAAWRERLLAHIAKYEGADAS